MMIIKPIITLAIANQGVASGLRKYDDTTAQSRANEPIPRPFSPDPICWVVTELFQIQQATDKDATDGKRKFGTK